MYNKVKREKELKNEKQTKLKLFLQLLLNFMSLNYRNSFEIYTEIQRNCYTTGKSIN